MSGHRWPGAKQLPESLDARRPYLSFFHQFCGFGKGRKIVKCVKVKDSEVIALWRVVQVPLLANHEALSKQPAYIPCVFWKIEMSQNSTSGRTVCGTACARYRAGTDLAGWPVAPSSVVCTFPPSNMHSTLLPLESKKHLSWGKPLEEKRKALFVSQLTLWIDFQRVQSERWQNPYPSAFCLSLLNMYLFTSTPWQNSVMG